MPLVQIDLLEGWSEADLDVLGECVQEALVSTMAVPSHDRFQIIEERSRRALRFDRTYLGQDRGERFVLIRVTLATGRETRAKQAFYARVLELLVERLHLRPDDLTVILTENQREDWSFGDGRASYLELPPEEWR